MTDLLSAAFDLGHALVKQLKAQLLQFEEEYLSAYASPSVQFQLDASLRAPLKARDGCFDSMISDEAVVIPGVAMPKVLRWQQIAHDHVFLWLRVQLSDVPLDLTSEVVQFANLLVAMRMAPVPVVKRHL